MKYKRKPFLRKALLRNHTATNSSVLYVAYIDVILNLQCTGASFTFSNISNSGYYQEYPVKALGNLRTKLVCLLDHAFLPGQLPTAAIYEKFGRRRECNTWTLYLGGSLRASCSRIFQLFAASGFPIPKGRERSRWSRLRSGDILWRKLILSTWYRVIRRCHRNLLHRIIYATGRISQKVRWQPRRIFSICIWTIS